jgi:AcrR family transcriptional regulator
MRSLASDSGLCEGVAMSAAELATASSRRIRQKRSQKTYDALISTAFKLLEQREFDEISIADLAQKAGYSVGAFYARFKSKDELFDAMIEQHIDNRRRTRARQFATASDSARAQRPLTEDEERNVRFAVQVTLGTVNNAIINRPGPIFLGHPLFIESLIRAFRVVSGYDELIAGGARPKGARRQKAR